MDSSSQLPLELRHIAPLLLALPESLRAELMLVGGQAVNAWALYYEDKLGSLLSPYRAFASKDLDLCSTFATGASGADKGYAAIAQMSQAWQTTPRYTRPGEASPVMAMWESIKLPHPNASESDATDLLVPVEFLYKVQGWSTIPPPVRVLLPQIGFLNLPAPHDLLRAKIANLVHLDQSERQDRKHVQIMLLCVREYLREQLEALATQSDLDKSVCGLLLACAHTIDPQRSRDAEIVIKNEPSVDLTTVWPQKTLPNIKADRTARFIREYLPRLFSRCEACAASRTD